MEFADFAEKFRQRTARRLMEFEHKLQQAQKDLERQAQTVSQQPQASTSQRTQAHPPRPPHSSYRESGQNPSYQVKSVLRRD